MANDNKSERGNLTLTRKPGQAIHLGVGDREVIVKVIGVSGNQVQIQFQAPKDMAILRSELVKGGG
jgi:carbon storage regulator CsrA